MDSGHSLLHYAGIVVFGIGAFCILVQAFEKGRGWGWAMFILGAVLWPVHVIKYWEDASFWFFVALAGFLTAAIF